MPLVKTLKTNFPLFVLQQCEAVNRNSIFIISEQYSLPILVNCEGKEFCGKIWPMFLFGSLQAVGQAACSSCIIQPAGLMVSALDSGASGPGSSPGRGQFVVFLGKTLDSHSASLHSGV